MDSDINRLSCRKIADKVALSGYLVVVPDFFRGDPFVADNAERPIPVWLKSHTAVCCPLKISPICCLSFQDHLVLDCVAK
jgi:hypothetical protein